MDNECDRAPIEIPRSPNRDSNSRNLPVKRHRFTEMALACGSHVKLHHPGSGEIPVYFRERDCVHAMGLKHDDGWNIPTDYPFYPSLPAIYRNVKFQYVILSRGSRCYPRIVTRAAAVD